ncbi:MAG: SpoIIIAH-like family protein [Oscillospiraceae bacterium]|nr:SpoIIIAH-like family protein [Oscillospiraceae bacterium]
MIAKKKQILTATLLIALICAIGVNWYYSRPQNNPVTTTAQEQEQNLGDSLLVAGSVKQAETTQPEQTTQSETDTEENNSEAFATAALNKTKAHDEIKSQIEKLINSESLDTESKNKITTLMDEFTDAVKKESDCESLITAKTGCSSIVIINNDIAQVIMQKNSLDEATILQITEIIEKNTNISAENLTIIEAK